jgi:hypothetical protein
MGAAQVYWNKNSTLMQIFAAEFEFPLAGVFDYTTRTLIPYRQVMPTFIYEIGLFALWLYCRTALTTDMGQACP